MVGLVAAPAGCRTLSGADIDEKDMDLRVRLIFMDRLHESIAGSSSISLAATSRIRGSVVAKIAENCRSGELLSGDPSGITSTKVRARTTGDGITFDVLGSAAPRAS